MMELLCPHLVTSGGRDGFSEAAVRPAAEEKSSDVIGAARRCFTVSRGWSLEQSTTPDKVIREPWSRRLPMTRTGWAWGRAPPGAPRLLAALLLLLALLGLAAAQGGQSGQNICPAAADIQPCGCTVKKNGLDILCETTETQHINKAMDALKRRGNAVIFYLKLRHNTLPKLLQFVFLGLDIRHLTIHNSSLAVVEESSLSSVGKKLTQLDLSQNILTMVPSKALGTLHHLLILNLNHNKISAIHNNAFIGLDTLEILTLYENKIDVVDANAFEGLGKKLKRLNLGGNGLRQVPQKALATLEVLRKLEMQENELTEIREGDFEGLRNLDTLNLQHNRLNTVPAKVFSHLKLLNSLELENNQIRFVDPEAFSGLEENLQYLRLGDNKLNDIPSDALRRLHRLRHLDLRVNNITFIPDDAFSGFGDSITFLNLQKNALKHLPIAAFEKFHYLERIYVQNNQLITLPEEVVAPFMESLVLIEMSGNPLKCDCDLAWYTDWYKNKRPPGEDPRNVICHMQSEHREYSVQELPLAKMGCGGKMYQQTKSKATVLLPNLTMSVSILLLLYSTVLSFLLV
ncbi:chondroadherin isoform X2 [Frankliniella occidentalis]|uniref:Chondroadherin isoform X2 n=1 Tax=Frankliniella occidentalis TaxID=133901 RepID=A0A9C6TYV6_FRAOC|nr:chondroadherin isoform X2 [Frankliniella occidentalis]